MLHVATALHILTKYMSEERERGDYRNITDIGWKPSGQSHTAVVRPLPNSSASQTKACDSGKHTDITAVGNSASFNEENGQAFPERRRILNLDLPMMERQNLNACHFPSHRALDAPSLAFE